MRQKTNFLWLQSGKYLNDFFIDKNNNIGLHCIKMTAKKSLGGAPSILVGFLNSGIRYIW